MEDWSGVTISNGRVIRLKLRDSLLAVLPLEIGDLSQLENLRLFENNIIDLPETVFRLTKIKKRGLGINNNKLCTIPSNMEA